MNKDEIQSLDGMPPLKAVAFDVVETLVEGLGGQCACFSARRCKQVTPPETNPATGAVQNHASGGKRELPPIPSSRTYAAAVTPFDSSCANRGIRNRRGI